MFTKRKYLYISSRKLLVSSIFLHDKTKANQNGTSQSSDGSHANVVRSRGSIGRSGAGGRGTGGRSSRGTGGTRGTRGTRAAGGIGNRGSDGASTGSASLRDDSTTSRSDSALATKSGGAREATGILAANLIVVKVKNKRKLLLGAAEGVRTVRTGGAIGSDTITGDLGANVVEESLIVLSINIGGNNTRKRVEHALADTFLRGRGQQAGSLPVREGRGRAVTSNSVGGGPRLGVHTAGSSRSKLGRKVRKVLKGRDGVVLESDETVVVVLLKVHVDDTTRPDFSHVGRVERRDILKSTGLDNVATILREKDRDGKVAKLLSTVSVTRSLKVNLVTTPFVHVDTIEISSVFGITAGEVVSEVATGVSIIVGRVTNGNAAVVLGLDVGLGVTNGSLDEGRSIGVSVVVGNLVTGKEAKNVGVLSHLVNDFSVTVVQLDSPAGAVSGDGKAGLGKIGNNVDTVVGKEVETLVVVDGGVDGVDTDDVSLKLLEVGKITLASGTISQGIGEGIATGRVLQLLLVSNTSHEELGAIVGVEELVALDDNLGDTRRRRGGRRGSRGRKCSRGGKD